MMVHDKFFKLGESVEVSPDDIGFKGSWYEAKIIILPKTTKNKTKSSKQYYVVEYKTLVEDHDESTQLIERIGADRIRPRPPPPCGEHDFQLDDVVEAFHRDGWWVGVVTKVFQECGKFQVTFSDPSDEVEFKHEDLRMHLLWKHGTWLQPQKADQPKTEEKSSEKKKGSPCKKQAGDGACKNVSSSVIPTPNSRKRKARASCDCVSMGLSKNRRKDSVGSSFGDVNQHTTNGEKDVQGYKEACNNKKEKDGISVSNQRSTTNRTTCYLLQSASACCSDDSDSVNRKRDTKRSKETFHNKTIGTRENACAHSAPGKSPNRIIQDVTYSVNESGSLDSETLDRGVATEVIVVGNGSIFISPNQESEIMEQPEVIEERCNKFINPNEERKIVKDAAAIKGNRSIISNKFLKPNQEKENVETVMKGSEIMDQAAAVERNHDEITNPLPEMEILEQGAVVVGNENNFLNPNQEREILEQAAAFEGNTSKVINPNQELNIMKEASAVDGNRNNLLIKPNQELAIVGKQAAEDVIVIDSNDQNLPFVKTSALWDIIESMHVFQAFPQRPHFCGLVDKHPVHCLEGKAVGYMLMFRDVVQKTADSRLDDARESIVQRLATLSKLEKNGFDVKGIRDRLTILLERKDEHSCIQNQLMEHNMKQTEIVQVIEDLEEKIKETQGKCAEAMSIRESSERDIAHFESKLVALCQSFDENVFEFEQLAAAPW